MMFLWPILLDAALAVVLLADQHRRKMLAVYSPTTLYTIFHLLVFVIHPLAVLGTGNSPVFIRLKLDLRPALFWQISLTAAFAHVLFYGGWLAAAKVFDRRFHEAAIVAPARQVPAAAWMFLAPFVAVGAYSLFRYWPVPLPEIELGQFPPMIYTREFSYVFSGTTGYAVMACQWLGAVLLILAAYGSRRWLWWLIAPYYLWIGWTGWNRAAVALHFLALVVLSLPRENRRWPRWPAVAALGVLAVLAGTLGQVRGVARRVEAPRPLTTRMLTGRDLAGYESLGWLLTHVPRDVSFCGGARYRYGWLEKPMPRLWWPGKPAGPALEDPGGVHLGLAGFSTTLPGELYWMGGHWSLALGMAAFGFVLGLFYAARRIFWGSPFGLAVWSGTVALLPLLYRGGLANLGEPLWWLVFPAAVGWFLQRQLGPGRGQPPAGELQRGE